MSYTISIFENEIMRAIGVLGANAYGVPIRQYILAAYTRNVSYGSLYACLDSLEVRGLIVGTEGAATPERGNRPKRYYHLNGDGHRAIDGIHPLPNP